MSENTNFIGNTTELEVLTYVSRLQYYVSVPFGGNARYDQIWDIDGKLYRVQIKTARYNSDKSAIVFSTAKYTENEIDGFATCFGGKVYYVPIEKTPCNEVKLRFTCPEPVNQTTIKNIKFAYDYELENILLKNG